MVTDPNGILLANILPEHLNNKIENNPCGEEREELMGLYGRKRRVRVKTVSL
jgi:hypothetical protein